MKLLSNLLSQRQEWKMLLLGFQVEAPELVGAYGHPQLPVEMAPCASKLQISFFFSCCFPQQHFLQLTGRRERGGDLVGGSRVPASGRTPGSSCPGCTFGRSGLCSIAFGSRLEGISSATEPSSLYSRYALFLVLRL